MIATIKRACSRIACRMTGHEWKVVDVYDREVVAAWMAYELGAGVCTKVELSVAPKKHVCARCGSAVIVASDARLETKGDFPHE